MKNASIAIICVILSSSCSYKKPLENSFCLEFRLNSLIEEKLNDFIVDLSGNNVVFVFFKQINTNQAEVNLVAKKLIEMDFIYIGLPLTVIKIKHIECLIYSGLEKCIFQEAPLKILDSLVVYDKYPDDYLFKYGKLKY